MQCYAGTGWPRHIAAVANWFIVSSSIKSVWGLENHPQQNGTEQVPISSSSNTYMVGIFSLSAHIVCKHHTSPILLQLTQYQLPPSVLECSMPQSHPSSSSSTSELCGSPPASCIHLTRSTARLAAHTYLALLLANSWASLNCLCSIFLFLHTWCLQYAAVKQSSL